MIGPMSEYHGQLELTWTNKDERLIAEGEYSSYSWVPPSDYRAAEVRLLNNIATVGDCRSDSSRASDNLLIQGDALHALTSLVRLPEFAKIYSGKVKLVYIDPPFNTGQVFEHYDDNLEHSVWLTVLRDRLILIRDLLAPDGSVWVHLDDKEVHRARSVMDEVFGPDAFVSTVVWENFYGRSNAAAISPAHNYIHIYAPLGKEKWRHIRNLLPREGAARTNYTNPDNDVRGDWRAGPIFASEERHEGLMYTVTTPTGKRVRPPAGSHWRMTKPEYDRMVEEGRITFGLDGKAAPAIKLFLKEVQDGLVPRSWWPHTEVGHSQEAKREIQALFPDVPPFDTPKPERLMQRIIEVASAPGEIVLDCFLGSGTTAAVAHKMGRRWIGIEWSAPTVATFAIPRLTEVVNGEDAGGISTTTSRTPLGDLPDSVTPDEANLAAKVLSELGDYGTFDSLPDISPAIVKSLVKKVRANAKQKVQTSRDWVGGGGFRVLNVADSMFDEDGGSIFLADWATNGALGEATAAQLGYEYRPAPPFSGTRGKTRLAVVDGLVNDAVVRLLMNALGDDERMVVCGTAVDPSARSILRELRPGSTLRKIPSSIIDEYRMPSSQLSEALEWMAAEAEMASAEESA